MSRTIEAIMRHMALPPSRVTDQSNRVQKLEKEITLRKRVIPETRSYWAAVVFTCIDDIILAITSFSASSLLIQRNTATMSLSQSM